MLEWYRAFEDYEKIMDDTEDLLVYLAREMKPYAKVSFRGVSLRWEPPYPRMSVTQAFNIYAGIDLMEGLQDSDYFFAECQLALKRKLAHNSLGIFQKILS